MHKCNGRIQFTLLINQSLAHLCTFQVSEREKKRIGEREIKWEKNTKRTKTSNEYIANSNYFWHADIDILQLK